MIKKMEFYRANTLIWAVKTPLIVKCFLLQILLIGLIEEHLDLGPANS